MMRIAKSLNVPWKLGLFLSLTGCAIQTPHLNISQWPMTQRAMYYYEPAPYKVVVLPIMDQRPMEERTGKRPTGTFLLLWNRRVGDYYTGDHVFGSKVADRLTEQMTAYLKTANVYAQIVPVSDFPAGFNRNNPDSIRAIAKEQAADFVLAGELEHYFGSQHQNTSIFLLPLYFINTFSWQNGKSLPWGKTTARFLLHDARNGDIIWRHRLEDSETLPRDTDSMAEAALESFIKVTEQLATELRELPYDTLIPTAHSLENITNK